MKRAKRVLLITMPFRNPHASSPSIGTLTSVLRQNGIAVDTLYGELLLPLSRSSATYVHPFSTLPFLPHLYPDLSVADVWASLVDWHRQQSVLPEAMTDLQRLFHASIQSDVENADRCLKRCFSHAAQPHYDIVGFSVMCDGQLPASLTLAQQLTRHNPSVKVIFGGAACLGEQADGIVASYPQVDAVCHTEGEKVIVPLVRSLRGDVLLSGVSGVVFRTDDGTVQHNPPPPLIADLDTLPMADYRDFVEQHANSEWSFTPPELYFESSRGCWWSSKKPCRFCGLNPHGRLFRTKSADRVLDELKTQHDRHPTVEKFRAADNVVNPTYFKTFFPRLVELQEQLGRPFKLFFEIRPSLRRNQVALLALSGVTEIQLGIESFSDEILRLMNKGVTALGNVQVLKWAFEQGFERIDYNIIFGTPGERPSHYQQMLSWLPYICHLPPPTGLSRLELMRFSEYFTHPRDYGLRALRPNSYYETVFGGRGVDLDKLCSHLAYEDQNETEELRVWRWKLARAADQWSKHTMRAFAFDRKDHVVIVDRRGGKRRQMVILGLARALFRFLDQIRSREAIYRRFPTVERPVVDMLLATWGRLRWVLRDARDRHLVVLPIMRDRDVAT